jgi:hypothetical protein
MNKDLVLYALKLLTEVYLKVSDESFNRESSVVKLSLNQTLEKSLEELVLAWLDSRGFEPKIAGDKFLSMMDVLLESLSFTITADSRQVREVDDRLKAYYTKEEYKSLAHTLKVTPTGAVRSATQNRLIEILETLSK